MQQVLSHVPGEAADGAIKQETTNRNILNEVD
jgi:hypothetical protein